MAYCCLTAGISTTCHWQNCLITWSSLSCSTRNASKLFLGEWFCFILNPSGVFKFRSSELGTKVKWSPKKGWVRWVCYFRNYIRYQLSVLIPSTVGVSFNLHVTNDNRWMPPIVEIDTRMLEHNLAIWKKLSRLYFSVKTVRHILCLIVFIFVCPEHYIKLARSGDFF